MENKLQVGDSARVTSEDAHVFKTGDVVTITDVVENAEWAMCKKDGVEFEQLLRFDQLQKLEKQ